LVSVQCLYFKLIIELISNLFPSFSNAVFSYIYFAWVTIIYCIAQYPLTTQAPPEFNQFKSSEKFTDIGRMFYVFMVALVDILLFDVISLFDTNPGWIVPVDYIFRLALLVLPLLWTLGVLPLPDTLVEFLGENFLVYACGGTPTSSPLRLIALLAMTFVGFAGVFFALFFGSIQLGVLVAAGVGFSLSLGLPFDKLFRPCSFVIYVIAALTAILLTVGAGVALHVTNTPIASKLVGNIFIKHNC